MSDEAALLAAIRAHPDEDTPRLMYADWLDEHGQPDRAEFIRIQCDPFADEAAEDRAAELEERNRAKWLAGLPQFPGGTWLFRRGFPDHIDIASDLLRERFDAYARVPWLRSLSVFQLDGPALRDILTRPWNSRWVDLDLHADVPTTMDYTDWANLPSAVAVANCPQVRQLRSLRLSLFRLDPEAVQALAGSPYLDGLRALKLDDALDHPRFAPLRERFGERLVIG